MFNILEWFERRMYSPSDYLLAKAKLDKSTVIALYGAGEFGVEVGLKLLQRGFKPEIWIDSYPQNYDSPVLGEDIQNPNVLQTAGVDVVIVCSIKFAREIKESCLALGVSEPKVISVS